MLLYILMSVGALVGVALAIYTRAPALWAYLLCIGGGVVVGFVLTLLIAEFVSVSGPSVSYPIVSLQDNQGPEGHVGGFIFISGSIGTTNHYTWYQKVADGGYVSKSVADNSDNSVEVYEGDYRPHVEQTENDQAPSWLSPVASNFAHVPHYDYKIYVPKGTIVRDFSLNAK